MKTDRTPLFKDRYRVVASKNGRRVIREYTYLTAAENRALKYVRFGWVVTLHDKVDIKDIPIQ